MPWSVALIASYRTADHCHKGPRNGSGRAIFGAGKTASGASLAHTGAFLSPSVKTGRAYCHIQLTVHSDQLLKGKGTISPAGIGKDPDRGIAECLWLWSPGDVALIGQGAVRRLTEKRHETWRKTAIFCSKADAAATNSWADSWSARAVGRWTTAVKPQPWRRMSWSCSGCSCCDVKPARCNVRQKRLPRPAK